MVFFHFGGCRLAASRRGFGLLIHTWLQMLAASAHKSMATSDGSAGHVTRKKGVARRLRMNI
jgi:hypothetical protein